MSVVIKKSSLADLARPSFSIKGDKGSTKKLEDLDLKEQELQVMAMYNLDKDKQQPDHSAIDILDDDAPDPDQLATSQGTTLMASP